jgi:transposase
MATHYPQEFKDQVVELYRRGRTSMELGRELNLSPTTVSNWVRAADKRDGAASTRTAAPAESDKDKIRRLEKDLARKEEELEVLGKAVAFFARRLDQ